MYSLATSPHFKSSTANIQCNGQQPCAYCRQKSAKCEYAGIDKRSLRRKITVTVDNGFRANLIAKDRRPSDPRPESAKSGTSNNQQGTEQHNITKASFPTDGKIKSPVSSTNGSDHPADLNGDTISTANGKSARFLMNHSGNARFFGESNPLSFLQECRAVFYAVQGPSHFVSDPKIGMVHDEPDRLRRQYPAQVPSKVVTLRLAQLFKENINDIFYVFNMGYFETNVIEAFYRNPLALPAEKLCLLYLVLAIGMLFAETSQIVQIEEISDMDPSHFYDSAVLVHRTLEYDGTLWQVEVNLLIHFYYQGQSKRTLSWVHLGTAIRFAQGLGMHRKVINEKYVGESYNIHRRRLWMSLFICDRISSINLGRPLGINDYEWDDLGTIASLKDPVENLRLRCQHFISKVAAINGKIVENMYKDGAIHLRGASDLANELKLWSQGLPSDLNLKTTFRRIAEPDELNLNYLLVLVHLSQFYGIMLLCKPFFLQVIARKLKPQLAQESASGDFFLHFSNAAIKSAFLTINLISKYVDFNLERLELFTTINCCFFASLILAFALFEQMRLKPSNKDYIKALTTAVYRGKDILYDYGDFNATSERWSENLSNMLKAIFDENDKVGSGASSHAGLEDIDVFKEEIIKMNSDESDRQKKSISFQETFVPTAFEAITEDELDSANMDNVLFLDLFLYGTTEALSDATTAGNEITTFK